jgi:DNA polymerase bacteriophage-type
MTRLHIDFETASVADLRKVGAAAYAAHPQTHILCMAYAFDNDPVTVWEHGQIIPLAVTNHVLKGGIVSGWNLQFEYHIWNSFFLLPKLMPGQLDDTQARAVYHGLPFGLEDAGSVLKLAIKKDKLGHALMLRMSRPRTLEPPTWWHATDPAKFAELKVYCANDVASERELDKRLPPLPPRERAIWIKDFEANVLGITVDKPLAKKLDVLAKNTRTASDIRMNTLTMGEVPTVGNIKKLLDYVHRNGGAKLPNIHKDTIKEALADPNLLSPHAHEVLTLRAAAAKTSAAKLPVLLAAAPDGVVRGMLAYYGAQRTGRWAGRLLQPQNLPRGILKTHEVVQALGALAADATIDDLEMLFGKPLDVIINLIRSCLVARKGKRLVVADFSQIEARVIAWLAGQHDILRVFERGDDVYTHTAQAIGSQSRQLGKVLVLACGFGQGAVKFQQTAKGYGLDLTADQCENAVHGWRKANSKIVQLWWDYERLAKQVAQSGGTLLTAGTVGKVSMSKRRSMMVIGLPSGRELFYHDIKLVGGDLAYWGVDQTTKRWSEIRTYGGKLAENITQAIARDVMAETMLNLPPKLDLLLTIHDELICECDHSDRNPAFSPVILLDMLLARMKTTPPWAAGLPVAAAGWTGERYRKA